MLVLIIAIGVGVAMSSVFSSEAAPTCDPDVSAKGSDLFSSCVHHCLVFLVLGVLVVVLYSNRN